MFVCVYVCVVYECMCVYVEMNIMIYIPATFKIIWRDRSNTKSF